MSNDRSNAEGASAPSKSGSDAAVNELANTQIGQKLRNVYDDVVSQDVPDRFLDLLNRLEQTDTQSGPRS